MDTEKLGYGDLTFLGPPEEWPIGRLFGAAMRLGGPVMWRIVERHGVSPAGFFLLRLLRGHPDGLRAGDAARGLGVTPATLTSVVNTLERDGFVERRRHTSDRRAVLLHATEAGITLLEDVGPGIGADMNELYDVLAPEDEPAVRRFLISLINRFEEFSKGDREC
ncbi:MarR family winged helix-turn-helix transcriptional regulator [Actinomadura harenae]|uniref:MarR family transcriptional regulator n=1 Tax=Actinomadura harenae TaxID=2483351 RepID=A0A3M2LKS1_9ACTN|nr:MarR family transcriptional regulator [Actinomadura harenae]RMI36645.1 MarR family transcriptional regulator [Actinomadura harenae]